MSQPAAPAATTRVPTWAVVATGILVLVGLGISAYLTYEHATNNATLACSDSGRINCLLVTKSSYSKLMGIPVAYLGLAYFVVAVIVMLPPLWRLAGVFSLVRLVFAGAGLLFVFYLLWAELFKLNAFCLWCSGVHVTVFLLFAITLIAEAMREPA